MASPNPERTSIITSKLDHVCAECGDEFDNRYALAGHIGSAHRRQRVPIPHGSEKGYVYHIRRGVPFPEDAGGDPCGCRAAHARFQSDRRRNLVRIRQALRRRG